jgi:fatty-acyl-CoA synthase
MTPTAEGVPRYYAESNTTWGTLLDRAVERFGEREALSFQGERWSYRELGQRANAIARGLLRLGVGRGSQVALWMPTTPLSVAVQFALYKIGARLVAVPTHAGAGGVEQHLEHSQATALIFQDNFWGWEAVNALDAIYGLCPELESAGPGALSSSRLPRLRHVICTAPQGYKGMFTLDDVIDMGNQSPAEELAHAQGGVSPNDPFQIMYLPGDGTPLAPVLPHRMAVALARIVADILQLNADDRLPLTPAFLPGFAAWVPLLAVYVGAALEIVERWEPEAILKAVAAARVTALVGDDEFFTSLLDHPQSETYDLGSVKKGLVLGAPAHWQIVERLQRRGLVGIMNAYGRAEVGLVSATVPGDGAARIAATSGRVMPHCRVKVIDPTSGEQRPGGQEGEVCVQGIYPGLHMMPGYHHNPEATEQRLDKEGWFHTGDRGLVDEEGYLHIRGQV